MQVTVNIPDELAAQVQSRGLTPQSYVEHLLAEQVSQKMAASPQLSLEEFDASLDELAQYSDKIPFLPDSALSRESFYQDHD
jgi:hypothetical protein